MLDSKLRPHGHLMIRHIKPFQLASPMWRVKQGPRFLYRYLTGLLAVRLARRFSNLSGIATLTGQLDVAHIDGETGEKVFLGPSSYRVVTDDLVDLLVDALDTGSSPDTADFDYGGFGTDATAEAASQSALVSELTTEYNPDNTRPSGTVSQPASNQLRIVATLTPDSNVSIEEFAPFTQQATGGGTMMDRSLTGTQSVNSGDSLEVTYTLTINSGG